MTTTPTRRQEPSRNPSASSIAPDRLRWVVIAALVAGAIGFATLAGATTILS